MFPTNPEEFDADDRISFSKISDTFILETEDGREFQWDQALNRWTEVGDEDEIARQQQAYAVAGVDEAEPVMNPRKKRKQNKDENFEDGRHSPASKRPRKPAQSDADKERKNTAVYVTNLPLNTDSEEVTKIFSRCGVIAEEIDSGRPRVKLYEDEKGQFKGDALIVYFRPESVRLAIQMLDDTDFRLGESLPAGRMHVAEADRSYKRQQNDGSGKGNGNAEGGRNGSSSNNNGNGNGQGGSYNNAKSRQEREREKKKVIARTQRLNARLADWSDEGEGDEPSSLANSVSSRWDKVVILRHMFTLAELDEDPAAMLDIKEDIRDECSKLGQVTNVVLYDGEPDGVASVRFSEPRAARACVDAMNGRWFAGVQVQASISQGQRFKKSNTRKRDVDEDEYSDEDGFGDGADGAAGGDRDLARADKFGAWLEETGREGNAEEPPLAANGGSGGGEQR